MLHFMSSCLHLTHTSQPKQHFSASVISLQASWGNVNVCLCLNVFKRFKTVCIALSSYSVSHICWFAPPPPQVPGVMSAPQVTSGTLRCLMGAASPASVTTTSTCMTQGPVTHRQAPVTSACITPTGTGASTANGVTTATLPHRAAGVSTAANVTQTYCIYGVCVNGPFMYSSTHLMSDINTWLVATHETRGNFQNVLWKYF